MFELQPVNVPVLTIVFMVGDVINIGRLDSSDVGVIENISLLLVPSTLREKTSSPSLLTWSVPLNIIDAGGAICVRSPFSFANAIPTY